MPVGVLLLAVGPAIIGAGALWAMAGFWWALAAYAGIGAAAVLLSTAIRYGLASAQWNWAPRSARRITKSIINEPVLAQR